jgi:CubicO group peptidase (beta-lactamase class C family)
VDSFYEDNPTYLAPLSDGGDWPIDTPESAGLRRAPLQRGADRLASLPQPLSFLVFRHGTLVWEKYFHGSQVSHSNNVHSASKSIIGALVGIALREGFLDRPDQSIADLLANDFKVGAKKQITLRHLLTMTSGLEWTEDKSEYEIEETSNWTQAILNLAQRDQPGSKFFYSTANTHLLSAILTKATGLDTCSFARKYLLDPMGMTVEHWGRDPQGFFSGGYNLYLTPRELAKFGQLYLKKGEWNGEALVPSDWVEASVKPSQTVDANRKYGYLWWLVDLQGHPAYKMWGYGGQFVYVLPSLDMVVVTTADTKSDHAELNGDEFLSTYVLPSVTRKALLKL